MPRIRRQDFIEARLGRQLNIAEAKADPVLRSRLEATGLKVEDLDLVDVDDFDGVIRGPRELKALFEVLKSLDTSGPGDVLTIRDGWQATPAGKALDAIEQRFVAGGAGPLPDLYDSARFPLGASVGRGKANQREDVLRVQQRLEELGLNPGVDGQFGNRTEQALRVYRSMLTGTEDVSREPGRIDPGDLVHQAFGLANPPRWVRMPLRGEGFVNDDVDHHGFGSSETAAAIEEAGAAYFRDYLSMRPGAALISVNDVSLREGGRTSDHASHQNGLDLDLRLPRSDGQSGSQVGWANYDREAAWAVLSVFGAQERVERIFFTDPTLARRARDSGEPWAHKLVDGGALHRNHIHIDIRPPAVQPS